MILELELTNFKQHERLTVTFREGLTGLRGANEAGKSSLLQAINYGFFGARALPLSLAETVTWGKPESSLKVRQKFMVESVTYQITRSKSGAELVAPGLLVSGQAEVTKYVEQLFKVNADAASKLMIASQGKLRGALESKEAVPLIEKLANINLIDQLIVKIQEQLPSGNTKTLLNVLDAVSSVAKPEEPDFSVRETNIEILTLKSNNAQEAQDYLTTELQRLDVAGANETLRTRAVQDEQFRQWQKALADAETVLAKPALIYISDLDDLYAKTEKQSRQAADMKAYETFQSYRPVTSPSALNLEDEVLRIKEAVRNYTEQKIKLSEAIITANLTRINEKSCALCDKLLQDIPEVIAKNAVCDSRKAAAEKEVEKLDKALFHLEGELVAVNFLIRANAAAKLLQAQLSSYTSLEVINGMFHITWTADIPSVDSTDYAALLRQSKLKQVEFTADATLRKQAADSVTKYKALVQNYVAIDTEKAEAVLANKKLLDSQVPLTAKRLDTANRSLNTAVTELNAAKATYANDLETYNKSLEMAAKVRQDIATHDKHNALIKHLREVRPTVAARLWATVLSSVSYYFSQIRGTPTVVTMTGDSFMADGRPVEGLSGSTLDSLGLAIRIALGKTFLPTLDFLLLDEPAQGMDDERESAMLGVLASANYKQVLVVTHSNLADSFASDIIQL